MILREQDQAGFGAWLDCSRDGPLNGLADGLRRARAAVEVAPALPWSTSPVEGEINRVKTLKRTTYNLRAKLDLLRARVLAA